MENTNIRAMDNLGRVVIPKEVRRAIGVYEGDKFNIHAMVNGDIVLRKVEDNQPIWDEPENRVVHLINEFEEETKVIKITPEQDKLLHWLYDEGFLHSDVVIGDGYPFPEIKDLT